MRISRTGIELIKSFEGFSSRTVRVDDEHWVIGFGHLRKSKDSYRVTREEAEQVLREYDLPPFESLVLENTYTPLHQGAFDALVSFSFNIGKDAFLKSDVLALLNAGETIAAAEAIGAWRKAKVGGRTMIVDALVRRRAAEKAMFLGHPSGPAPAPSAILRPIADPAVKLTMPRERAVVIDTSVKGDEAIAVERSSAEERRALPQKTSSVRNSNQRLTDRFAAYLQSDNDVGASSNQLEIGQAPSAIDTGQSSGPTPEEITKAISELVNGSAAAAELNEIEHVPGIDLPEAGDDFVSLDTARGSKRFERTLEPDNDVGEALSSDDPLIIDDLEEVQIAEEDIERALRVHNEMKHEQYSTPSFSGMGPWPFAFLASLGAFLFTWGMLGQSSAGNQTGFSQELLLIIVGALLFLIMAVYFFREFSAKD